MVQHPYPDCITDNRKRQYYCFKSPPFQTLKGIFLSRIFWMLVRECFLIREITSL